MDDSGSEVYASAGYYKGSSPLGDVPGDFVDEWVVDVPRETVPNTEKIDAASQALRHLQDSDERWIVKYMIEMAFDTTSHSVNRIEEYMTTEGKEALEDIYNALCSLKIRSRTDEEIRTAIIKGLDLPEGLILGDKVYRPGRSVSAVRESLGRDIEELGEIYRDGRTWKVRRAAKLELKEVVQRSPYEDKVSAAAKELGYSRIRTWWCKHLY